MRRRAAPLPGIHEQLAAEEPGDEEPADEEPAAKE